MGITVLRMKESYSSEFEVQSLKQKSLKMATIKNFEDLKVWQKARILCQQVFDLIQKEPFSKDYKLRDQINGSSGSVMDNIEKVLKEKGTMSSLIS